ncbi:MAG: class I SAM-dependent methyltransferase [Burkholderiaceae bacterium]|nr:class I SAM-dependent methyltransferase [Burkholderiaceae bacterium]
MTIGSTPGTGADPAAFTAAARTQWERSAEGWNEHTPQIRAWLRDATDAMLDAAGVAVGRRVLDVAAGAGEPTIDIARRVGPTGFVLATDFSPAILRLAQENVERAGLANVQFREADATRLPVEDASFDATLCRLGLMLFRDPAAALREMHRALRPGGHACTLVFSAPDRNPCIGILMSTALQHAGLPPRDPFTAGGLLSLGKPGLVDELFRAAGFERTTTTKIDAPFRLPSARAYLDFVRSSASPIQQILGALPPAAADAAWSEMEERLGRFSTTDGWVGPNELLLTVGRR